RDNMLTATALIMASCALQTAPSPHSTLRAAAQAPARARLPQEMRASTRRGQSQEPQSTTAMPSTTASSALQTARLPSLTLRALARAPARAPTQAASTRREQFLEHTLTQAV